MLDRPCASAGETETFKPPRRSQVKNVRRCAVDTLQNVERIEGHQKEVNANLTKNKENDFSDVGIASGRCIDSYGAGSQMRGKKTHSCKRL